MELLPLAGADAEGQGSGVGGGEAGTGLPRVRLVVEVADFEAVSASGVVIGIVDHMELRQADGLLVEERYVQGVEPLSRVVARQFGVESDGPAIRVFVTQKEE